MSILVRKHQGVPHLTGIAKLSIVALTVSFSASLIDTIWAVYLDSFLNSQVYVGLFSSFLTIIAFVSYFLFIPIIEKGDKAKIYSASLIAYILFYLLFSFNSSFILFFLFSLAITLIMVFRITSFGLIVRDISKNSKLSRNEGLVYTFNNIAWVLGPLLAGYLAAQFGERSIFVFSTGFLALGFIFFKFSRIKDHKGKIKTDKHIIRNFIDFFKSEERTLAYALGGGISVWWTLIYLFMPLQIIRSGLGNIWIGYFLFAVAVPLILLEYPFSKLAGKKGFRKMFKLGYLLLTFVALISFFITNIYFLLGLLVLGGIGIAMLEPTTEAYFFDIMKGKEEYRYYGPYNTALDTGGLLGRLPASLLLIFLPFNYVFLLMSLFMFVFFLLSFKVKKIVEAKRR